MKTLFTQFGSASPITLKLYTSGTEDVSWVKGIDSQVGSGFGSSVNTYTEGGSYITLAVYTEPVGFVTSDLATVTNATVDITGYKRVYVDWEAIKEGVYALIVDGTKLGDIADFEAKATYGAGTTRKITALAINALTGSKYIRINSSATTTGGDIDDYEIRIHRVWLEK
jgi:hypothetical protein